MIALNVQDVKDFMARLLISEEFDSFWLCELQLPHFQPFKLMEPCALNFLTLKKPKPLQKAVAPIACGRK